MTFRFGVPSPEQGGEVADLTLRVTLAGAADPGHPWRTTAR